MLVRACFNSESRSGFTLIEMVITIATIGTLAGLLLPVLVTVRSKARATSCLNNMNQIGMAFEMYKSDYSGFWPTARDHYRPNNQKVRWPLILARGGYIGQPATADDSVESVNTDNASTSNPIRHRVFICPDTSGSRHQVPNLLRERYARSGSYGMNWQTIAPFPDIPAEADGKTPVGAKDPLHAKTYPVNEARIRNLEQTIVIGDSYGEFDKSGHNIQGPHAYTLDPPKLIQSRWGTKGSSTQTGKQTPADPRHDGKANFVFGDGHAGMLTLQAAGYSAEHPEFFDPAKFDGTKGAGLGDGNNRFWTGDGKDTQ